MLSVVARGNRCQISRLFVLCYQVMISVPEVNTREIMTTEKRKNENLDTDNVSKKPKLTVQSFKSKQAFNDEIYNETSYYMENGLRKVYPYYFTFTTFTKGRWVGKTILDVFTREFSAVPAEEYKRCIESGSLTVNSKQVSPDYKLKHNDRLSNIVHRHEVPVSGDPITIVHMDEELVVINKPASIPVHPCGRYRHNTVAFILAKEYKLKNLRTLHRLDRLTSGLLLLGKSLEKSRQIEHQIKNRLVQKEYVCRVEGEFPDGAIECNESIEIVSHKVGVCKVSPNGKDCSTVFKKLSYNGRTSVVSCKPTTGRMHQIRVHLQYLGFPIIHDPLYNHVVFGPLKGKGGDFGGKTDKDLVGELLAIHNTENWLGLACDDESLNLSTDKKVSVLNEEKSDSILSEPLLGIDISEELTLLSQNKIDTTTVSGDPDPETENEITDPSCNPDKIKVDVNCRECKLKYRDPKPQDLVMFLHAWKYKGPDWEFETELPAWSKEDWKD